MHTLKLHNYRPLCTETNRRFWRFKCPVFSKSTFLKCTPFIFTGFQKTNIFESIICWNWNSCRSVYEASGLYKKRIDDQGPTVTLIVKKTWNLRRTKNCASCFITHQQHFPLQLVRVNEIPECSKAGIVLSALYKGVGV